MPVIQVFLHCEMPSTFSLSFSYFDADGWVSAQGAAQAIEDGATLGYLFAKMQEKSQIKDIICLYEMIRKPRTSRVIEGSNARRNVYQLQDGKAQRERDHDLVEEHSSDRYPKCMEDPEFQSWLLEYDPEMAVDSAWQQYQNNIHVATNSEVRD